MFLFRTAQSDLRSMDPDNPDARWSRPEEVSALLTHPVDAEFFESLLPQLSSEGRR